MSSVKAFLVVWSLLGGNIAETTEADFNGQLVVQQVNVNHADADTLATVLNGCGLRKAHAIINYRKEHGPFKSIKDLAKVEGISEQLVLRNKSRLLF
ncbi:ComEA family DNA-binding protein [Piscirickettsia litoralis]|uniref:Competence protein ComEA n=1 Tax=Piscirickettsia litoralis TaxID=1891921 RepID=A0ABX3A478_9GAMM|nr:helix-hairpin-helix domain-containing protein [Piscirickettsia litoralis]ODN43667.1 competence protein ComEA [Piscirickettsia litoralis]